VKKSKRSQKIVLDLPPRGGSGFGQTFWRSLVYGCARRTLLGRKAKGDDYSYMSPALVTGTIYHRLQEEYHTRKEPWDVESVTYRPMPANVEAVLLGERLFRAYRARWDPDVFGDTVATEQRVEVPGGLGFPELAVTIDHTVKLNKRDVPRIRRVRHANLSPGYWIRDYKALSSWGQSDFEKYTRDLQFMIYQMGWQAAHPKRKLQGMIIDVVTKTIEPRFYAVVIRPPSARDRKIVKAFAELATAVWEQWKDLEAGDVPCNPERCFDWHRTCPYLNRACKRY